TQATTTRATSTRRGSRRYPATASATSLTEFSNPTGRRFESVRGLCKSPAGCNFSFRLYLHDSQRAVDMEPSMEPSGREARLDTDRRGRPALTREPLGTRRLSEGRCPAEELPPRDGARDASIS